MRSQEDREKARSLKRQGLSVRQIAKEVKCGIGTVSLWTNDISCICSETKASSIKKAKRASEAMELKYKKQRFDFQKIGKEKALRIKEENKEWEYLAGCMLFWAEGSKNKNMIDFCNSNPDMMRFFILFLRKLGIKDEEITISINCYLNNGLTLDDVQSFWLNSLNLPKECLRKSVTNMLPCSSQQKKKNRHIYGVCKIRVCSTKFVQEIFGAIKEFCGFEIERFDF